MGDYHRSGATSSSSAVSHRSSATLASTRTTRNGPNNIGSAFSCNRCNKPLSTNLYVCGCDCIFCEDCCHVHFSQSSQCPSCSKTLGGNDFMQLCISEAPANPPNTIQNMFQTAFTKGPNSVGSQFLQYADACRTALQAQEAARRVTQVCFKQLARVTNMTGESSGRLKESYERLKQDFTQLQQSSNAQRLEAEQAMSSAQNKSNALKQQLSEQHQKNKELLQQVDFFRGELAKAGFLPPPSPGGSMDRGSVNSGSAGRAHSGHTHSSGNGHGNEQSRHHHHGQSQTHGLGQQRSSSFGQGIRQPPPPLREIHANRQLGHAPSHLGHAPSHHHRQQQRAPAMGMSLDPTPVRITDSFDSTMGRSTATGTGAPPIRDLRGGYTFSGRTTQHHGTTSVGGGGGSSSSGGRGQVLRVQQSFASSRPTNYGRSKVVLGGRRR